MTGEQKKQIIITRAEAIKRGLRRYYTGIPCLNGHIEERYTKGMGCYGCSVAWRKANPDYNRKLARRARARKKREAEQRREYKQFIENGGDPVKAFWRRLGNPYDDLEDGRRVIPPDDKQ